jgi:hypothetical protein
MVIGAQPSGAPMTFRIAIAGLLLATLAGCDDYNLGTVSTFEPTANPNQFRFKTVADPFYPEDDQRAEAARIGQLEKRLTANGVCADGYSILERRLIRVPGVIADGTEIYYTVQCA